MKGLLIKDMLTLKGQFIFYLALIALFALVPGTGAMMALVLAAVIPKATLAYDEQCRWDQLAGALPYTVPQLVLSKYALGLIATLGAAALAVAAWQVEALFIELAQPYGQLALYLAAGLGANLLLQGITLPITLRMGSERGRLLMMGVAALVVVFLGLLMIDVDAAQVKGALSGALMVGAIAVYLLSIPVSLRAYRRRHRA